MFVKLQLCVIINVLALFANVVNSYILITDHDVDTPRKRTVRDLKPFAFDDAEECGLTAYTLVRGEATKKGEFPWLTIIYRQLTSDLTFHCVGSLVTHQYVVTAGHCVYGEAGDVRLQASTFIAIMGRFNIRQLFQSGERIENVTKVYLHPQYHITGAGAQYADVAVLELENEVTFGPNIRPICLWTGSESLESSIGKVGTVVGWSKGINKHRQTEIYLEPRKTAMTIVSNDKCVATQKDDSVLKHFVNNKTLCAGNLTGQGPCVGDSGGGLYLYFGEKHRWYLRGVVSVSLVDDDNDCDYKSYFVFTDAAKVAGWIKSIIF